MTSHTDFPVKILLTYDIANDQAEEYYRFMLGHFVPTLQQQAVRDIEAWHTAVGNYPMRLLSIGVDDRNKAHQLLENELWQELESRLMTYVTDYQRRIVPYRQHFQF
ncbi:MAG TPA: hypothetical protein PK299_03310 [Anaerolineales bacterium]|nr:hypothetical protein [Anaerolineales bacterium]